MTASPRALTSDPASKQGKQGCTATNRRGEPCMAPPLVGSSRCAMHAPEHRGAAQRARRAGGRARMREVDREPLALGDLSTPGGLAAALGLVARAVAEKRLAARDANAITLTISALARLVAPVIVPGLPPGVRVSSLPSGAFRLALEVVRDPSEVDEPDRVVLDAEEEDEPVEPEPLPARRPAAARLPSSTGERRVEGFRCEACGSPHGFEAGGVVECGGCGLQGGRP